jgi:hypothetical protein
MICLIEAQGGTRFGDSIFVFLAEDFSHALRRAIELGRTLETTYENEDGNEVRWRLKEVLTLDAISTESLDGAEVYSEPVFFEAGESYPFDAEFRPETSETTQTI